MEQPAFNLLEIDEKQIAQHIGKRLKVRRTELGLSQAKLASMMVPPLVCQQVQKYEKGSNTISSAKLAKFAHVTQVPIQYFYEGLLDVSADMDTTQNSDRANLEFMKALQGIHPTIHKKMADLVRAINPKDKQ